MSAREKKRKDGQAAEFQVNEQELQALSERVAERKIEEKDWEILHRYLLLVLKLSRVLQYGRIKIKKIARMLFGVVVQFTSLDFEQDSSVRRSWSRRGPPAQRP